MKYDFCGYATRYNVKCSDGRTIKNDAFKHCDGLTVPLMFQHGHNDPMNVVGNCLLESRNDGMYCYGSFNETASGDTMKECVAHGDITSLSIYANHLRQNSSLEVFHGDIKEVSLVLAGANVGAYIEDINIEHNDEGESEAIIYTDESDCELQHSDSKKSDVKDSKTIRDVIDTMNEDQKGVLAFLVTAASSGDLDLKHEDSDEEFEEDSAEEPDEEESEEYEDDSEDAESEDEEESEDDSDENQNDEASHSDEDNEEYDEDEEDEENNEGGNQMKRNVFDNTNEEQIVHADFAQIIQDAMTNKATLSDSVLMHADEYGIQDIESLFPDPKDLNMPPEWIKPEDAWVPQVLNGVSHTPFSRIRTRFADITADEARAKGYVKGNRKKEEVFSLLKRETTPCTIYKKQKLDRDDISGEGYGYSHR